MGAGPRTRQDWVPLAGRERIAALDVLRGLALLGIALMNVEWFSAPLVARVDGIDPAASGLDLWLDAASYVLVSGKFWVLFALLFGMGFAVMQARAQEAGRAFAPFYLRRTFALLAIGVVHACLIWSGDILVAYALAALLMLACFSRAPVRGLWAWGGALYYAIAGVVALFALLLALFGGTVDGAGDQAEVARQLALQRDEVVAYTGDSYLAATAFRIRFLLVSLGDTLFFLPMALGVFVFGAWLVRSGAVADADGHRRLFRGFSWGAAPLGLALTLVGVAIDPAPDLVSGAGARPMAAAAFQLAGAPLLSLGYLGWVVLALQRGGRWLRLLAPAGRMALTLYLMQSAVGTLVFYGYGFGLWGQVGRSAQVAGVLVVFVLQLVIAHAWMARFRFGPVEWLWRGLTYRALPPLRRSSGSSPEAAS